MGRILAFLYGLIAYAFFFGTILYAILFVGNINTFGEIEISSLKTIDSGKAGPVGQAVLINVLLLGAFAVQHTIMARPAFKERWTKFVPRPIERSTYVLFSALLLDLTFWQWRPIAGVVWSVEPSAVRAVVWAIYGLGWVVVFYSTFLIDHFDLFGLRQVWLYLVGKKYTPKPFMARSLYKWVRHPLMLGFMIAFWATPEMSYGHLLFSIVVSAYIFIGIKFEERDLLNVLGEDYRSYHERTSMIIPLPQRKK